MYNIIKKSIISLTITFAVIQSQGLCSDDKYNRSLVHKRYNYLSNYNFEGKKIVIFGCGHGNQNECGQEGNSGDHSHQGVTCISIDPESKGDYTLDLTKTYVPEELHGTADIIYFEYLTPTTIYHPVTMANALLILKSKGEIIWDTYWPYPRSYEAAGVLKHAWMRVNEEITYLNTQGKYAGIFKLSSDGKNYKNYYSVGDNPFNGRKNSSIFHISREDIEQTFAEQYITNLPEQYIDKIHPDAIIKILRDMQGLLDIKALEDLNTKSMQNLVDKLKQYNSIKCYPHLSKYHRFDIGIVQRFSTDLVKGKRSLDRHKIWLENFITKKFITELF